MKAIVNFGSLAILLLAALAVSCGSQTTADDPHERCNLPEDYDILQVPPDPCLWSDPEFGKTFRAAYAATNVAKGPCHAASFSIVGDPGTDRTYRDADTLAITIEYNAPGCTESTLTFGGFHVNGSPWAMKYCGQDGCYRGGFGSNIRAKPVPLTQTSGTVTFVADPGTFPPIDIGSPPNLEGFQLCAIIVGFNDGRFDGSRTSEQLNLSSEACDRQGD